MDIYKNYLNICIDNFYDNANLIINSFEPENSTIFLFTNDINLDKDFIECFPKTQIYINDINNYLEKILQQCIDEPIYNKIIFFNKISINILENNKIYKNFLDVLNIYNITIFLHIDFKEINFNWTSFNFFIPNPIYIDVAKRLCFYVLNNINWMNFINEVNLSNYRIIFKKNKIWEIFKVNSNFNYSEYIYPIINDLCKSNIIYNSIINQEIFDKKINNDINCDENNYKDRIIKINKFIGKKKVELKYIKINNNE
jgi:hypothetical protein